MADLFFKYRVVQLSDVLAYFADGFHKPGVDKVVRTDWWLDSAKGEVVFRLTIEPPPPADDSAPPL